MTTAQQRWSQRIAKMESSFDLLVKTVDELSKRVTRLEFKVSDHITADRYRQQEQETNHEAE